MGGFTAIQSKLNAEEIEIGVSGAGCDGTKVGEAPLLEQAVLTVEREHGGALAPAGISHAACKRVWVGEGRRVCLLEERFN